MVVWAPGGVPTEKGVGEPPVWEAGPVGVSALLARESGGCPPGRCGPWGVGWGGVAKPSGRRLKTDNQTSTPVIDLVQKSPLFTGAAGFLSHERSFPEPQ